MTLEDMLNLVPVASQVANDPGRIKRYAFSAGVEAQSFTTENGAAVQMPNFEAIDQLFEKAIFDQ